MSIFGSKPKAATPQAIPPVSATAKEVTDAQRETLVSESKRKGLQSTILSKKIGDSFGSVGKLGGW